MWDGAMAARRARRRYRFESCSHNKTRSNGLQCFGASRWAAQRLVLGRDSEGAALHLMEALARYSPSYFSRVRRGFFV